MSTVTSKDGTTIAYIKYGSGPLVILVSGAMGYRQLGFLRPLAELLSQHFTVIDYDRRGRGESTDTQPYSVEKEVEDIDALIKANGGSAHLLGLSSGAVLALRAAAAGLNVTKLALYEPPFTAKTMGTQFPVAAKEVAQLVAEGKRGKAVDYFSKMVGAPKIVRLIMRLTPMWPKFKSIAHTLPYDLTIIGDGQVPLQLAASVQMPTLALVGAKSPTTLQEPSEQLAKALPNAQFTVLEGQAHNVSMKALAPVLIEFFKK